MSFKTGAVSFALIAITAATVGVPLIHLAQVSVAASDLAQVSAIQTLASANDGSFASSMTALTDDSLGRMLTPTKGVEMSYIVSADHWIAAAKLPSGEVLATSDTLSVPITCAAFTANCISQITPDATLVAAVPVWTTF